MQAYSGAFCRKSLRSLFFGIFTAGKAQNRGMKRKTFLRGAATLGISGAAVKCLGALYRVPLVAFIGCYGLGLYQSSYAFFAFITTLCSAGIASALSKQVADSRARGVSAAPVVSDYLRLFVRVGLIGGLTVAVFPLVFHAARGESYTAGYFFLAPAVPIVCVSSVLCGAFQGADDMLPTAASEITGQIAKIALGLLFCAVLKGKVAKAATFLCLAVTLSVLIEDFTLIIFCKKRRERGGINGDFCVMPHTGARFLCGRVSGGNTRRILAFTLPVTLSAAVLPLTAFAESMLLPSLFKRYAENPLALYGLFAGGAACISHLPVTLCRGVGAAAIPDLSAEIGKNGAAGCGGKISYACLLTLAVAVPAGALMYLFAPLAAKLLFRSLAAEEKAMLTACVRISAAGAVFLSLAQTLSSCLTALGKQRGAAACWGVACLSRILFDLVFAGVLKFSAKGAAAAESLCYFVAFFLILLYNKACVKGERIITEAKA